MRYLHTITGMALSQALEDRNKGFQIIELADGSANHLHQLRALLRNVSLEQRPQARVGFKQILIKKRCCLGCNSVNFFP